MPMTTTPTQNNGSVRKLPGGGVLRSYRKTIYEGEDQRQVYEAYLRRCEKIDAMMLRQAEAADLLCAEMAAMERREVVKHVSVLDVLHAAMRLYGVDRTLFYGRHRTHVVAECRMVAWVCCRDMLRAAATDIAAQSQRQTHSTIFGAYKRFDENPEAASVRLKGWTVADAVQEVKAEAAAAARRSA